MRPKQAYLIAAVIIFAAANAFTRFLTEIGAANPVEGRNPISLCNVLFVGNLCALAMLLVVFRRELSPTTFQRLSRRDWIAIVAVAILSGALAPALIFAALDFTSVNSVILLGRIEPPLALLLSVLVLRARVNVWVVLGAVLAFVGVVLTVVLQSPDNAMMSMGGIQLGQGEIFALGGAIAAAFASILSKISLQQIPLGLFNIIRTALGTVVFFIAAISLFGVAHFSDAFSPLLWKWMVFYGAVIIVGGQLCWFAGLRHSTAAEMSLAHSLTPILGIIAAFLILGEVPTVAQFIGGGVILAGIVCNQIGILQQIQETPPSPKPPLSAAEEVGMEQQMGFRGV